MEYPVWQLSTLAGGFWIAVIATLHVFVAHFAVGGGLFLVLTEARARRENSRPMLDYVRRHTRFFLLLTMVFGGLSGVAIWFTISVLAPAATSTLIHHFVWGWATEWVFFLGEIAALLVYHYRFDRMRPRDHLITGWLYFIFAWLSLFIINGIIGLMLTPGEWLRTENFWDGFFNPTFWPSLVMRSFLALMLAGVFGLLTALRIPDEATRTRVTRRCAGWAALALPPMLAAGWWYLRALPPETLDFISRRSAEITPYATALPFIVAALFLGSLIMALRLPHPLRTVLAALLLLAGFGFTGSFEYIREAGRKPWIIHGHTWAQGIRPDQAGQPGESFLARARWVKNKDTSDRLAAGRELFAAQCLSCHSIGGPMNDIRKHTAAISTVGMEAFLTGQGRLFTHMPPFLGDKEERRALAEYVAVGINGRTPDDHEPVEVKALSVEPLPFDSATAQYVLLAWNTLGMKCITDCDAFFSMLPPGNALGAVLLRRGSSPAFVTEGVELGYELESGFADPASQVAFWTFAPSLLGKELPRNISATGRGVSGTMALNEQSRIFEAAGIPVTPYTDAGEVNPYPLVTITARDKASGEILAQTKAVAPVGSEMGCRSCHGGPWRVKNSTGIAAETARNILAVHDKRSGTSLLARAEAGGPVLCQSCHPDPLLNAAGDPQRLGLPAAIHGFHANYLTGRGEEVCSRCHPDSPVGVTRCLRDNHAAKGIGCSRCHGFLEDHALSLLKRETEAGKPRASLLMRNVRPRLVADVAEVRPRTPWQQEPECMTCHTGGVRPDAATASAFNVWTEGPANLYRNRKDAMDAVPCIACHNSPHATYPADNAYGKDRDNLQPLQYMGFAGSIGAREHCALCHETDMPADAHH